MVRITFTPPGCFLKLTPHTIPDISLQVFVCGLCPTRQSGEGVQNHRPNRKSETQVTSLRGQMFISPGGIDMTP